MNQNEIHTTITVDDRAIKVNDSIIAEFDKPLKNGEYMFKLNYDGKNYKAEMTPLWWYKIKKFFRR